MVEGLVHANIDHTGVKNCAILEFLVVNVVNLVNFSHKTEKLHVTPL